MTFAVQNSRQTGKNGIATARQTPIAVMMEVQRRPRLIKRIAAASGKTVNFSITAAPISAPANTAEGTIMAKMSGSNTNASTFAPVIMYGLARRRL